jgi:hypothetical protein
MGSAVPPKEPDARDQHGPSERADVLERLRHAIEHAGHLLPAQGPIEARLKLVAETRRWIIKKVEREGSN